MKKILIILLCWLANLSGVLGQGYILWNENVNGPISEDPGTPTPFGSLLLGTNSVIGASSVEPVGNNWLGHGDYFSFMVPSGSYISSILFVTDRRTWVWLGDPSFSTQLGFLSNPSNGDLLPQFGLNSVSQGAYSMYVLNHDLQPFSTIANYRLDFGVSPVPEPSTWALLILGSAAFWFGARRRRK